jgi:hypothetical protein
MNAFFSADLEADRRAALIGSIDIKLIATVRRSDHKSMAAMDCPAAMSNRRTAARSGERKVPSATFPERAAVLQPFRVACPLHRDL